MLKMKRRTMALVLAAAMGTSMLAGCGKKAASEPAGGQTQAQPGGQQQEQSEAGKEQQADSREKKTLTIALASEIGGLDPVISVDRYGGNVYLNIYETLMKVDDKGEIVPNLCTSFEQPDGKT